MARSPENSACGPAASIAAADSRVTAAAAEWFARRDAGLTADEERAFQNWIAADPSHEAAFARLDATWSTFGKPVRMGVTDELLEELARRKSQRRRRTSVAVATLLGVLASGLFWRVSDRGETAPLPPTASLLLPAERVLPDGSRVVLNEGAQIAAAFTDTIRRVELTDGEAHFTVVKDLALARPFLVVASGVEVRAVGTAFSVQVRETAVEVLVTEGTVAVDEVRERDLKNAVDGTADAGRGVEDGARPAAAFAGEPPSSSALLVGAGKRVVIELAKASAAQVTPMDAHELGNRLAWRNPRLEFSGTPLAEAVALLNRESVRRSREERLVIADPALKSMRVSGIFRTDNFDGFVLLLEEGFGLKVERSDNTITLRKLPAGERTN